jgi:hypothetical protein
MIWRSTAQIVVAFVAAGLAIWFSPDLLVPLGLGEFARLGQLCFAILVLSVLDAVFVKLSTDHAIGPAENPPPDR